MNCMVKIIGLNIRTQKENKCSKTSEKLAMLTAGQIQKELYFN